MENPKRKSWSGVGEHIYIGQYFDAASALSYLNARYYSPSQGQFLSEDSMSMAVGDEAQVQQISGQSQQMLLTDPQSLNFYSYGRDNPNTNSDPNGKIAPLVVLAWGAGAGFCRGTNDQALSDAHTGDFAHLCNRGGLKKSALD